MPSQVIWLIFLLPVISFGLNSLFIRPWVNRYSKVSGYITIAAVTGSLALSIWALAEVLAAPHHELIPVSYTHLTLPTKA